MKQITQIFLEGESPTLKINFVWACGFYRHDHVYTYKAKDFHKIFKENIVITQIQLLLIY